MVAQLDIQLLRTFVTVADARSISAAARHLHLTQSATSLQMRRLEEHTGGPLFRRSRHGVQLTAAGEALLPYARRMLQIEREALSALEGTRVAGDLRFGTNELYARRYLPEVLARFRQAHPQAHAEVVCDISTRLAEQLHQGELDLCLIMRHHDDSPGKVIASEDLVWVGARDLVLEPGEPIPLALFPSYCVFRNHGVRALAERGRPWRLVFTSQSDAAIDIVLSQGLAATIRARRTLDPRWQILEESQGLPPLAPVAIELLRAPGRDSELVTMFARLLEDAVARDVTAGQPPARTP